MRSIRLIVLAALGAGGMLGAHVTADAVTMLAGLDGRLDVAHGHLRTLVFVVAPIAAVAILVTAIDLARRVSLIIRPGTVLLAQLVAFGLLEVGERLLQGIDPAQALTSLPFWLAVALQPLFAWVLVALIGSAADALRWFGDEPSEPPSGGRRALRPAVIPVRAGRRVRPHGSRGPPRF